MNRYFLLRKLPLNKRCIILTIMLEYKYNTMFKVFYKEDSKTLFIRYYDNKLENYKNFIEEIFNTCIKIMKFEETWNIDLDLY